MRFLLIGALLPAVVLMIYIYRKDRVEKEPIRLLAWLVAGGAFCCLPAAFIETVLLDVLDRFYLDTVTYAFFEAFLIVAVAEEGCKNLVLRIFTWNQPDFDCTFDGIVYAVFVSLGFAALENVHYAMVYGSDVLFDRAIFSIPGHMTFAVYMGVYYSKAKREEVYGRFQASRRYKRLSFWVPVLLHGFYDFCLMSELESLALAFFAFVVILDIAAIARVRREARMDQPIAGWENYAPQDPNGGPA